MTPTPNTPAVYPAILQLFQNATQGTLIPAFKILDKTPAVTMQPTVKSIHEPEKVVFLFAFNQPELKPETAIGAIQAALGSALPGVFNGLQPKVQFAQVVAGIKERFPATDNTTAGLIEPELKMLENWLGGKEEKPKHPGIGPHISSGTEEPLEVHFHFAHGADADRAKEHLESRLPAIREKIIEMATPYLTAEQQQELAKMEIRAEAFKWDAEGNVRLKIGVANEEAVEKLPDGKLPLKPIAALNTLAQKPMSDKDPTPVMESILRYATLYANETTVEGTKTKVGEDWAEGFPLLAGGKDMKGYLEYRAGQLQNEALKAELANLLPHEALLSDEERKAKRLQEGEDFKITPRDEQHPFSYRLRLSLPKGMTKEDIETSLINAAAQLNMSANDNATPAVVPPAAAAAAETLPPPVNDTGKGFVENLAARTPPMTPAEIVASRKPDQSAVERVQQQANSNVGLGQTA